MSVFEPATKKRKLNDEERKMLVEIASEVIEELDRGELCAMDKGDYDEDFNLGPGIHDKMDLELFLVEEEKVERITIMEIAPMVLYVSQEAEGLMERGKLGSYEWRIIAKLLQCFPKPEISGFINPVEKAIMKKWISTCSMLLKYVKDQISAEMKLRESNFKKRKIEEQEMLAGIEVFYELYRFAVQMDGLVDEDTRGAMRMIATDEGCLEIFLSRDKARDFLFRVFGNQIGYPDEVLGKAFNLDDQE